MNGTSILEEARLAYNAEISNYRRTQSGDARALAEGMCCYEQATILEVNPEDLADYIEQVEGYRPDPSLQVR